MIVSDPTEIRKKPDWLRLLITTIFRPLYLYWLRLLITTIFWPLYLYGLRLLITTIFWPLYLYRLRLLITTIFWPLYLYGLRLLITTIFKLFLYQFAQHFCKHVKHFCTRILFPSNLLTMRVHDEGYSRNTTCVIN